MANDRRTPAGVDAEVARLLSAFDNYIEALRRILEGSKLPDPMAMPTNIVLTALLLKVLRLADSVRSLCLGGHGRDSAGILRSQLQAFANLKFIHNHADPQGAWPGTSRTPSKSGSGCAGTSCEKRRRARSSRA